LRADRANTTNMPARERGAYYPALDGIRALSVLLVMSFHIHSGGALVRQIPGWAGVDCFCVLSGFLITTLLIREESSTGHIRLGAFYIRRFFRIVPVFFTALLLYVPVAYFGEHGARWELFKHSVPLYLTFMQDFVSHDAPLSASWTLGIEEKFYALWPLLGFVILRGIRAAEPPLPGFCSRLRQCSISLMRRLRTPRIFTRDRMPRSRWDRFWRVCSRVKASADT
jgi:peptidoglycan/LPS O-acetylase OafA/YrhL